MGSFEKVPCSAAQANKPHSSSTSLTSLVSRYHLQKEATNHLLFSIYKLSPSKARGHIEMSGKNYNNNNNNTLNNNNNDGSMGKNNDPYCTPCMHSCGNNNSNNNNNGGAGTNMGSGPASAGSAAYGVPPIQVTAKVLFGSVSAISALNAERKKKS